MHKSETVALTAAHLHKAVGNCFKKLRHHCSEIAPKLLQEKEDIVSQISPLSHSHLHFYPRKGTEESLHCSPLLATPEDVEEGL